MSQKDEISAAAGFDVSRETVERLEAFSGALLRWSPAINLVSARSGADVWLRHILDSAQLWRMMPADATRACDVGSGGGLPAIVLACLAAEASPALRFTLIESDTRKAAFLTMIGKELSLSSDVIRARSEKADPVGADVVSARALAPLPQLLGYCHRHLSPSGTAILPKGRTYQTEIENARHSWRFDCKAEASLSDPESAILVIRNLHPVEQT